MLSLLSKNVISAAGLSIRKIRNIKETERCNVPLYVIPSESIEIKFLFKQVRHPNFSISFFGPTNDKLKWNEKITKRIESYNTLHFQLSS